MDQKREEIPQLLVIRPPSVFKHYQHEFARKFHLLKAYESPLPTLTYLETHAHSARAVLSSGKSPLPAEFLDRLPSLEIIVNAGTGLNHIYLPECRRRGIVIANTGDIFSEDTADYAVGLFVDVLRRISHGHRFVRRGLWPVDGDFPLGIKLKGKRVGIVGLGNIGNRVARRIEAMGCIISYTSRNKKPEAPYTFYPNINQMATDSDILVVCCPLTNETRHMVNADVLIALGKDGILVNVGRGPIVNEKELVKFLVRGDIAGAALDVFEDEPNVPKELYEMDNVVLSPHSGAFTEEGFLKAFQLVMGNLEGYFLNKQLISPVHF